MSMSKERQYYHLTPSGWKVGSFIGDALGGKVVVEDPSDRVKTICVVDEMNYPGKPSSIYAQEVWESDDSDLVRELIAKHGNRPDDELSLDGAVHPR